MCVGVWLCVSGVALWMSLSSAVCTLLLLSACTSEHSPLGSESFCRGGAGASEAGSHWGPGAQAF